MKDKDRNIYVSTKHKTLRTIAFVLAVAVAVTAFTIGVLQIGHQTEGYQTINAQTDEDAVNYANDIKLAYYFTGSSNEIKSNAKELSSLYSNVLKRAYKFLDAEYEYAGYNNIATLNAEIGETKQSEFLTTGEILVGPELYGILERAYAYTVKNEGYNMFAGALYAYWNSILTLDEPATFDPVNDAEEAERLEQLTKASADLSNFTLEFIDEEAGKVCFGISEEYIRLLDELEIPKTSGGSYSILDLNLMHDAFLLEWVANELESRQYTDGYFETPSGLMLSLPDNNRGEYCFYDFSGESGLQTGTEAVKGSMAVSHFRNVPIGDKELEHYSVNQDGQVIFRSPFINANTGTSSPILANSYVVFENGSVTEAAYRNIVFAGAETAEELKDCSRLYGESTNMLYSFTEK